MGHIVRYGISVKTSDFKDFWKGTTAYRRDGCDSIKIIPFHSGNCTETVINRFWKKMDDREGPDSYEVRAYDLGITGYEAVRIVPRIVNHKRTMVEERKEYKTKPKRVLKGAKLMAIHQYILDYDCRDYDPREHW